ncbi:hypothetical protein BV20DRAFT_299662 [Pilatotrama ljubarskyi]|nr:hypothetical protein BV20DRAFT_299662 [Pilatotrama ljubarskyi]
MFFPRIPPHPRIGKEVAPHPPPKDPPSPPPKGRPGSPPAVAPISPSRFQTQRAPSASRVEAPFVPRATSLSRSASQRYLSDALHHPDSPEHAKKRHMRTVSEVEYTHKAVIAGYLETIFDNMLAAKGVASHPHRFLDQMLRDVFGPDCADQTQTFELAVPSRELMESGGMSVIRERAGSMPTGVAPGLPRRSDESEKGRPSWMNIEWDKKEKKSDKASVHSARSERSSEDSLTADPKMYGTISPKARQLLFGDDRSHAVMNVGPYQPPGLLLLPATFIPCSPLELEMHACKNMNTLLGCKYALSNYMTSQRAADGSPLVSEREVDDYLWDYECFRRKRFNWPQDIAGLRMEDEPEPVPQSKPALFRFGSTAPPPTADTARSQSTTGAPMHGNVTASKETSTHVRTIRVYEAIKVVARCAHR